VSFPSGHRLGAYQIVSLLGAGGMGEVYRARDTRLERTIALKVMPADIAADPQFRARFDREAKSISQLSHPHVCALYDIGEAEGTAFLVMELLQGETLADRLKRGALPLDETLKIAIDIADALAAAHRQGIVHRDLKPANIMLTKSGAKLLDFGLAKPCRPVVSLAGTSSQDTAATTHVTGVGAIVGTPHYMSPEQIEGAEADARSDIWALGVITYEAVTGRRPFEGTSAASILGAILRDEPQTLSKIQPLVSPSLNDILSQCLVKDRESRWQSARDLMSALKWASAPPVLHDTSASRWPAWLLLAAAMLAAVAALIFGTRRESSTVPQPVQFAVLPPDGGTFSGDGIAGSNFPTPQFAVAPDGRRLALIATRDDGRPRIWLRPRESIISRELPGTEGAAHPFWSPDGKYIGFFAGAKLKTILADGGPVQVLCDAVNPRGGTWNKDGVIVFAAGFGDGLQWISAAGGHASVATEVDAAQQEISHRWPQFLPDGRHFLYLSLNAKLGRAGIYVAELYSKEKVRVLDTDFHAEYSDAGYLLFVREGGLLAQRFDPDTFKVSGDALPIADRVGSGAQTGESPFSVSRSALVYAGNIDPPVTRLTWTDRSGGAPVAIGSEGRIESPDLSVDDKRVVVHRTDPVAGLDIWVMDGARPGTPSRFTFDPAVDFAPTWSPDGRTIAFSSNRTGTFGVYARQVGEGGDDPLLVTTSNGLFLNCWSSDGRVIMFTMAAPKNGFDLWMLSVADRKATPVLNSLANETQGQLSVDSRWLAYTSDETGIPEVYVQPFPPTGAKWQVSIGGGSDPRWRRDGRELFYITLDGKLTAAQAAGSTSFEVAARQVLFQTRRPTARGAILFSNYKPSADGQRFLVNTIVNDATPIPIFMNVDWSAGLER